VVGDSPSGAFPVRRRPSSQDIKLRNEALHNLHYSPNIIFFSGSTDLHWTFTASHVGGFLELFRHMVGLLGRVISPSQGLYLHRTTQHKKTRTNIHALSGIRTHDSSNQPTKTHASDRTATVTGMSYLYTVNKLKF
jgi:hypothetical protein